MIGAEEECWSHKERIKKKNNDRDFYWQKQNFSMAYGDDYVSCIWNGQPAVIEQKTNSWLGIKWKQIHGAIWDRSLVWTDSA